MHLKEGTCLNVPFSVWWSSDAKSDKIITLGMHVGTSNDLLDRNAMFRSVNQSSYNCFRWGPKTQTYRARRLLYGKVRHSTVLHVTLCVHTFLNWRNILFWIPFGFDLDLNGVCKCRERETPSADRQVERERERERERDACVLFEFRQIFLLWELVYVFQSLCRSLQKIWSYEMSSGFNSLVQY